MAKQGHTIIVHGRNKEKAAAVWQEIIVKTENKNVACLIADLLRLTDIKRMSEELKNKYNQLDVLINNAGAFFGEERETTSIGFEKTITLNLFVPFLLTTIGNFSQK